MIASRYAVETRRVLSGTIGHRPSACSLASSFAGGQDPSGTVLSCKPEDLGSEHEIVAGEGFDLGRFQQQTLI